ncbi:hypothetical protein MYP_892 [Sporocytophaga myxococcoides]|uniref:Uncharacterized protein n=1 Tax=Sporocytophaga myxococcoides TaxID=153721 RepID=A0A098L9Q4_9BACT|nr:hypothetical protein [Sporocytophaga myxococcoides]GAL83665.1 hypothetical protein MYP_892 [Sporocytophaga myxococcoides]
MGDLYKDKYENEIISDLNGQLINSVFGTGISSNLRPIANKVNSASAGKLSETMTVKEQFHKRR